MKIVPKTKSKVKISHGQSIKLSRNYNSVECSFGITIDVAADDASIEKGFARIEKKINEKIQKKAAKDAAFLSELAS